MNKILFGYLDLVRAFPSNRTLLCIHMEWNNDDDDDDSNDDNGNGNVIRENENKTSELWIKNVCAIEGIERNICY